MRSPDQRTDEAVEAIKKAWFNRGYHKGYANGYDTGYEEAMKEAKRRIHAAINEQYTW